MKIKAGISLSIFCTILGGAFLIERNDQKRWQAASEWPLFSEHLIHMTYQETKQYPFQPREYLRIVLADE
ncbi:hypothetical protein BK049_12820 [Bacillus xiamenensis]|uniref:Uncharacterized protein n=1 Tax=Bacillus xiamenensis TaxID=1178537 RepID=A0AAC9ND86_9BACI|nr:hypothetical protein [Bacillus xiamenensis]AOZ89499.1 hypothetical protein BK049_12820 [Bacillus xiamenensis]